MRFAFIAVLFSLAGCGVEPSTTEETTSETLSTEAAPAVTLPKCSTETGGICAGLQLNSRCNAGPQEEFCLEDGRLPDGSIACVCEVHL